MGCSTAFVTGTLGIARASGEWAAAHPYTCTARLAGCPVPSPRHTSSERVRKVSALHKVKQIRYYNTLQYSSMKASSSFCSFGSESLSNVASSLPFETSFRNFTALYKEFHRVAFGTGSCLPRVIFMASAA